MTGHVATGEPLVADLGAQPPADTTARPPEGEAPIPAEEREDPRRRRRLIILFLLLLGVVLLLLLAIWYFFFRQPIRIPLPNTVDMPGYATSLYGARAPMGVAVTPDGSRIYVAQTEGDRTVIALDAAGSLVTTAIPDATTGEEHVPVWLAADPLTSNVYASDRPTGQIYVYGPDGTFLQALEPKEPIPGWQPMGLAFDPLGNLYVSDLSGTSARVEMFDRELNLVQTFGATDLLSFPNGVAVDARGNVYVADSNNGRLLAYRPDGSRLAEVGRGVGNGELGLPRGVTIDGSGRIYVVDTTAQGVLVYRLNDGPPTELEYLGFFGGAGVEDARFAFPNGIAADGRGRLYLTDTGNDRVQLWGY